MTTEILKVFFLRGQNFSFEILRKKKCKNITKNHLICVKHGEKTAKEVKKHKFLACACKSQDFAQGQTNFARSHDRTTARFRNSVVQLLVGIIFKRLSVVGDVPPFTPQHLYTTLLTDPGKASNPKQLEIQLLVIK